MEDLYDELWGKDLDIIQDRTFSIPRLENGFHPAYKVNLGEIGSRAFPDPKFAKKDEKKVFKILQVKTELPCGSQRLLVRQEYEAIKQHLVEVESDKWSKDSTETEIPAVELSDVDSETQSLVTEFSDIASVTEIPAIDLSNIDRKTELPGVQLSDIAYESKIPETDLSDIDSETKLPGMPSPEPDITSMLPAEWSYVGSNSRNPFRNLDFKLGGQPGSGKSFFLSYLLACRLIAGQPTVFRVNDGACYLFDSISPGHITDANRLFRLPSDEKKVLWILTDEELDDARWSKKTHGWFVVLAASPAKIKLSKQWKKDRNPASRYMSNWGWDEIVAAFCLERKKAPKLHEIALLFKTFSCLGPIARTCLESISVENNRAYKDTLDVYLDDVDHEIDTFIQQGGFQTVENRVHERASHRIALMDPSDNRLSCNLRVTTRWIAHKVFEQTQAQSRLRCFELYNQLAHQGRLRSSAGWMFEAYAHDWFRMGGSFTADQLPITDNKTSHLKFETYQSKTLNYFTDAKSLAKEVRAKETGRPIRPDVIGKYFLPYNANFESVDALVFSALDTLILLQITIAESHDIKLGGLKKLCQLLPSTIKNLHIIFIISQDVKTKYLQPQSVPSPQEVRPKAPNLTITQFRLVLTEKLMLSMDIDVPQDGRKGGSQAGSGSASTDPSAGAGGSAGGEEDESGGGNHDGEDTAMGGTQ